MATIPLRFSVGSTGLRYSFTPVEAITGGQLVEWRALSSNPGVRACGVAAADSLLVAGVALHDIRATASSAQDRAVVGIEHALTVVAFGIVPVTFTASATRGQSLIPTAAGQVTPVAAAGATYAQDEAVDSREIIGFCAQDSVSTGAVGLAFIRPSGG